MSEHPTIEWTEAGATRSARWRSEAGLPPPKRVIIADDRTSADAAYHMACEGTAMLWRGDFQNARQLLQAMARRVDRPPRKTRPAATSKQDVFNQYRLARSQRARTLGMLLLQFEEDHTLRLRRAPDVREACLEVYGATTERYVASLRELLGLIGAHEWRKKGIEIPAMGARIHPHYGVFAPVRSEYVKLVAEAPLPTTELAFDIGTGTGVLAAVLAKRGVAHVIATEHDARALECARDNIERLNLSTRVEVIQADLFPPGRAPLIICNPPWVPARPATPMESAIFDPDSRMLHAFVQGLTAHLTPRGEGWLILSDLAEHLGLRTRDELLAAFAQAGLEVIARTDVRPSHPKILDTTDALRAARAAETT
ncbi:MAG TPA: class I SAM-dependent methyltransferase, partial [Burkholderiales bacterium]|nr:class I SAM-dependent methyltransferase [Burkholderiales bacterium]